MTLNRRPGAPGFPLSATLTRRHPVGAIIGKDHTVNHYEAKQEARRARLEARAERLQREGQGRIDRAHKMAEAIPFGQPILIGHHSERRDRNYRGKIHSGFDAGFKTLKAAGDVAARAASIGSGGISSDDPDAIAKLRDELTAMEKRQDWMKRANEILRRHKGAAGVPHLIQAGYPEKLALSLIEPDFAGHTGFASFQLTNNSANMRRVRARIAELEARAGAQDKETEAKGGLRILENVEANRLQLIFPDKPSPEIRAELKAGGFRWAPSEGAWQRQLSNGARYAASRVVAKWEA